MDEHDRLAAQFEAHRPHLRSVAHRMLGSPADADDAVQEAWLRYSRADTSAVENHGGWLTTVVGRVCLDALRRRASRREASSDVHVPDPLVTLEGPTDAAHEVELADSIGLALLVVLDTLAPAERIAFVLHDLFAVPFDEIARIIERSPAAARQLASRARRRVQGASAGPAADRSRQPALVEAFLAASRAGDFEALLMVLDPDVVLRLDRGPVPPGASKQVRGGAAVAGLGFRFSGPGWDARPAQVNGAPGLVVALHGRPMSVIAFRVAGGRIAGIDILADPARIARLGLASG